MTTTSFDAEKTARYISSALMGFINDPADSDFQRGYLSAMLTMYREGLGRGRTDDRLKVLDAQVSELGERV